MTGERLQQEGEVGWEYVVGALQRGNSVVWGSIDRIINLRRKQRLNHRGEAAHYCRLSHTLARRKQGADSKSSKCCTSLPPPPRCTPVVTVTIILSFLFSLPLPLSTYPLFLLNSIRIRISLSVQSLFIKNECYRI